MARPIRCEDCKHDLREEVAITIVFRCALTPRHRKTGERYKSSHRNKVRYAPKWCPLRKGAAYER